MTRRTRVEILIELLSAAVEGASKTRIMYRANLNFKRCDCYIKELLGSGLLEKRDVSGSVTYVATERGKELLEILRKTRQFLAV
jgi:predicted transcriptional regulator